MSVDVLYVGYAILFASVVLISAYLHSCDLVIYILVACLCSSPQKQLLALFEYIRVHSTSSRHGSTENGESILVSRTTSYLTIADQTVHRVRVLPAQKCVQKAPVVYRTLCEYDESLHPPVFKKCRFAHATRLHETSYSRLPVRLPPGSFPRRLKTYPRPLWITLRSLLPPLHTPNFWPFV